jgi:KDO2-lipid IV(A) lauroyltransferase
MRTVGVIPISLRSALGGAIGNLVGRLPLREARIATLQLRAFLPEASSSTIVPKVFENVGRSMMESLNLQPFLRPPFRNVVCPQWDTIHEWSKDERPIIALTAHTGNWDLLAAYTIARGIPLSTVGREARNPNVQVALRSMREAYGINTIWRSDKSGIKRIIGCFKERRVMAALIDQDTRVDSVFVPFFNTPAKTPSALIDLGKRFNARFVSAFIIRTGGTRFEIHTAELDGSKGTEEILKEYHHNLEHLIRKHPDQWVWIHKRWRSDPSGTTLGTKDYLKKLQATISSSRL